MQGEAWWKPKPSLAQLASSSTNLNQMMPLLEHECICTVYTDAEAFGLVPAVGSSHLPLYKRHEAQSVCAGSFSCLCWLHGKETANACSRSLGLATSSQPALYIPAAGSGVPGGGVLGMKWCICRHVFLTCPIASSQSSQRVIRMEPSVAEVRSAAQRGPGLFVRGNLAHRCALPASISLQVYAGIQLYNEQFAL